MLIKCLMYKKHDGICVRIINQKLALHLASLTYQFCCRFNRMDILDIHNIVIILCNRALYKYIEDGSRIFWNDLPDYTESHLNRQ
jgi:hypothetical protein